MPKLDTKEILKQIAQKQFYPMYWIFGPERYKTRELVERLKKELKPFQGGSSLFGGADQFDGSETAPATILDSAQAMSLGGGLRVIVVREAQEIKNPEMLEVLAGPLQSADALNSVCIFIAKDLDQRKKFSKTLVQKAAVVECSEVEENDRENWIQYLAKNRGIKLESAWVERLMTLDPWSLDGIASELEKLSLSQDAAVLLGGDASEHAAEIWLDALFERNLRKGLPVTETVSKDPATALPLLGLLSWNARQLALLMADQKAGTRTVKINPYVAQKLERWKRKWSLEDLLKLQHALHELDFSTKQTPKLALGLWTELVLKFETTGTTTS